MKKPRAGRDRASALPRDGTAGAGPGLSGSQFRDVMTGAPLIAFVKDLDGRYIYANASMLASADGRMGSDWQGKTDAEIWPPSFAALVQANDDVVLRKGGLHIFTQVAQLPDGPHTFLILKFPLPSDGGRIDLGGVGIDVTEHVRTEGEHGQLVAAVAQASDSVVITDLEALITYVNPAFERVSGYSRDEVIGRNPRLLKSTLQPGSFYEAMWAALTRGTPWVADFVNRHKDGSLFTEEAVITPVRNASGKIASYVAVKRDVTDERASEQRSTRHSRERALIAEMIRGMHAGDTLEITGRAICGQVAGLSGVRAAQLMLFERDGRATPIGFTVVGQPDPPLQPLPYQRSRHLRARAAEGPWIEPWVSRVGHPYNDLFNELGVRSTAYAPVHHHDRLIGLLAIEGADVVSSVRSSLAEALPALVEFADLVGALVGREVAERTEVRRGRDRIRDIIAKRAFSPVFQPIVDLASDAIVGYEALTRFADGADPASLFDEAAAFGIGAELEMASLRAALAVAVALPGPAWLDLNVSPELIVAGGSLRTVIGRQHRHVVLEVTEHAPIADYPAFRTALAELGPGVELSVDDAGAGFASLRHILELHPAFVKLDRWLVTRLESDEARQAMIAGLGHFAGATGCRLVAEGVETEQELAVLRTLGVELGQGYLLGRPLPITGA